MHADPMAQADLVAEIHAALGRVNVREEASSVPEELLRVLVATGESDRAEAIAKQAGSDRYRAIVVELWRRGERERARHLLPRAADCPSWAFLKLVEDLFQVGAVDEARGVVHGRIDALDEWKRAALAVTFIRRGRPGDGLALLDGREDVAGKITLALMEAGDIATAEETARRITAENGEVLGELSVAFADHGRPGTAEEFALRAGAAIPEDAHPYSRHIYARDDIRACAALTRTGHVETAVTRLGELSREHRASVRPMADAHKWSGALWGEFSGWAGCPRRFAGAAMAEQAVKTGIEDRLLEEAGRRDDTSLADLLRAAVAICHAQAGDGDRARGYLADVVSVEGLVEGRLALARAVAGSSPVVAVEAALQAVELVENADRTDGRHVPGTESWEWTGIRKDVHEEAAVILALAGEREESLRVADRIPTSNLASHSAFRRLAEALGEPAPERAPSPLTSFYPDFPAGARQALDRLADESRRPSDALVDAVLRTGDVEEITALLPSFDPLEDRHAALARAACALLDEGRDEAARLVAVHAVHVVLRTPPGPPALRMALTRPAAVRLAVDGDLDRALALVRKLSEPWSRAPVFIDIIVALLDSGDVHEARRVLAEAGGADSPYIIKDLPRRMEEEGMAERLPALGLVAVEAPREGRAERGTRERFERLVALLLHAPDGIELDGVDEYAELVPYVELDRLLNRLVRAAKFKTALNVVNTPDEVLDPYGDGIGASVSLRVRQRIRLATAAYDRDPALAAWAEEIAELAHAEASDTRTLAMIAGFPGWPADRAISLFRSALAPDRHNHTSYLTVLTEAIPLLARLDGGRPLRDLVNQLLES